jgi:branched-chain amino acid transport system permease protein
VLYREAGQFKTSYSADQGIFPILQDRIGMAVLLAVAFVAVPMLASDLYYASKFSSTVLTSLITGEAGAGSRAASSCAAISS